MKIDIFKEIEDFHKNHQKEGVKWEDLLLFVKNYNATNNTSFDEEETLTKYQRSRKNDFPLFIPLNSDAPRRMWPGVAKILEMSASWLD